MKQNNISRASSVIVFDLDETLGYFSEFSMIWNYLLMKKAKTQVQLNLQLCFNDIFDQFPELLRPLIIDILKSLNRKKKAFNFEIMLYTNNNGKNKWVQYITAYLEYKINQQHHIDSSLFFKVVYSFKINGKSVNLKQTTRNKTLNDFLISTSLPKTTQICFIDDTYYSSMNTQNVFYINVDPYIHNMPPIQVINRLKQSNMFTKHFIHINLKEMYLFLANSLVLENRDYKLVDDKKELNIVISKTLWKYLNQFLMERCKKV